METLLFYPEENHDGERIELLRCYHTVLGTMPDMTDCTFPAEIEIVHETLNVVQEYLYSSSFCS